ncbi:hypothetical protein FRC11_000695 [Ceratobasidium sp. 423]|nr:hypothetical protein FRC11_000695 [Ceratobasidium sp. 423]
MSRLTQMELIENPAEPQGNEVIDNMLMAAEHYCPCEKPAAKWCIGPAGPYYMKLRVLHHHAAAAAADEVPTIDIKALKIATQCYHTHENLQALEVFPDATHTQLACNTYTCPNNIPTAQKPFKPHSGKGGARKQDRMEGKKGGKPAPEKEGVSQGKGAEAKEAEKGQVTGTYHRGNEEGPVRVSRSGDNEMAGGTSSTIPDLSQGTYDLHTLQDDHPDQEVINDDDWDWDKFIDSEAD